MATITVVAGVAAPSRLFDNNAMTPAALEFAATYPMATAVFHLAMAMMFSFAIHLKNKEALDVSFDNDGSGGNHISYIMYIISYTYIISQY